MVGSYGVAELEHPCCGDLLLGIAVSEVEIDLRELEGKDRLERT
jgi:hypothetical protein